MWGNCVAWGIGLRWEMYCKIFGDKAGKKGELASSSHVFFSFDLGTQVWAVRIVLKISAVSSLNPSLYALLCTPWRDRTEYVGFFSVRQVQTLSKQQRHFNTQKHFSVTEMLHLLHLWYVYPSLGCFQGCAGKKYLTARRLLWAQEGLETKPAI